MIVFIALAKGELGKDIEKYLQAYGLYVQLDGRPMKFVQRIGNRVFRPMQSKDVPWYVAGKADYGITGEDLVEDYLLGSGDEIKIVDRLGFGKADLVVFARDSNPAEIKRKFKKQPTVIAPNFYSNLVANGKVREYLRKTFGEYDVELVAGSTEGFVARGDADIGFDLTTYFQRPEEERERTTLSSNGLKIVERIMPTEAVAIAKPCYTADDFRRMLGTPLKKEMRIITTGNMSEIEVVKYSDE